MTYTIAPGLQVSSGVHIVQAVRSNLTGDIFADTDT